MRHLLVAVLSLVSFGAGCDGSRAIPAPRASAAAPAPVPVPAFMRIGEAIKGRVTAGDPPCVGEPQWLCQFFQLTTPSDGTFEVILTHTDGNLNVSVTDAERSIWWWDPQPVFGLVRVKVQAKAGATYQIAVWEYERPGVEFELRTSLRPN